MGGRDRALLAAEAALNRKAEELLILDVRGLTLVADYFLLCNGRNALHVKAVVDGIVERLKQRDLRPGHTEGYEGGRWVLLDYGDVVVHVFHTDEREYYHLERLWGDAAHVELPQAMRA